MASSVPIASSSSSNKRNKLRIIKLPHPADKTNWVCHSNRSVSFVPISPKSVRFLASLLSAPGYRAASNWAATYLQIPNIRWMVSVTSPIYGSSIISIAMIRMQRPKWLRRDWAANALAYLARGHRIARVPLVCRSSKSIASTVRKFISLALTWWMGHRCLMLSRTSRGMTIHCREAIMVGQSKQPGYTLHQ